MREYKVLYQHYGENSDTAKSPVREYQEGEVDLGEQITCCLNWDNDMLVKTDKYAVHTVTLPDWLPLAEWIANRTAWRWLWGMGADPEWSEAWQRGLLRIESSACRLAAIKLLKTATFRSAFRASLRDQLVAWLETPPLERQYKSPFSPRQWDALVDQWTRREAQSIDTNLYYSGRYAVETGVVRVD